MLGSFPSDVAAELGRVLKLCTMWNALLLIDEAEVFLGSQTDDGLVRNELVSSSYNASQDVNRDTNTNQSPSPNSSTTKASSS
jgi:hypothetical protein